MQRLASFVMLFLAACFEPVASTPDAGPPPTDTYVPLPAPEVVRLRALGRDGVPWPLDQTPRRPLLTIETTRTIVADEREDVFVFRELPMEAVLDDLARPPLLVAHARELVPCEVVRAPTSVTLTPQVPLVPGARYLVALAGWAHTEDDQTFAPFVAPFRVATSHAGALPTASWPPDGAAGVPPELALATVRFDDTFDGEVHLRGPDGPASTSSEIVPCDALGWDDGTCVVLRWDGLLRPSSTYTLEVDADSVDRSGAPLEPWRARFETGWPGAEDFEWLPVPCALDERPMGSLCVLADDESVRLRAQVDRPVRAFLYGPTTSDRTVAPRGELVLSLDRLDADRALDVELRLVGLDGNEHIERLSVATTPTLASVTITEVCADPRGPEPRQEWVELLNFGAVPVRLEGFALSDRPDREGDLVASGASVPAGGRVLLVADAFDASSPDDPSPPAGVPLVRLGTSLASGGLSNAGEPLYLRDAEGRRISSVPATPSDGPGTCIRRTGGPRDRDGFVVGPCTPGAP
ncbi:MAG: lamin tail domain-containing protein [Sandaracinus sp.]|nr:lamin tail domain-containing protein [Sandaracinus sp.]